MTMIRIYILATVAGIVAMMSVYHGLKMKIQSEAIQSERARVEKESEKIDAKAQKKLEAVRSAKPDEVGGALRKYCRDC